MGSIPGSGRSPGEGNGNTLQYSPGKVHGQRNLVGYSSGGRKDLDMTEHTCSNKVRSVYQMVSKLNAVGTLFFYTSVNILMPFT